MKMSNKKFVAMATAVGLTVGLLSGCGPATKTIRDKDDDDTHGSGVAPYPYVVGNTNESSSSSKNSGVTSERSSGAISGSKGIGSVKAGGAGS